MAHALSPDLRKRDLDSATVTDVTSEANTFELPAMALPVLYRSKNTLTEKSVSFRFE
tara:strand:+ start:574 stop:744 length:171 start_codon:yes stop_codon:yes gene_type:complete